jgi:hypothetical protein
MSWSRESVAAHPVERREFIIEHPTRGVFIGWKDSPSTGEHYPAFAWSRPRNDESTVRFASAEDAWAEIDRMPKGFHDKMGVLLVPGPDDEPDYRQVSRPIPKGRPVDIEEVWGAMLVPIVARHSTIERLVNETNQAIIAAASWRVRQIHPTARKIVVAFEDEDFYVNAIVLQDGTTIPGIPDTVEEDDPLEEVQSLVGDLYPLFGMAKVGTVELEIEDNHAR